MSKAFLEPFVHFDHIFTFSRSGETLAYMTVAMKFR